MYLDGHQLYTALNNTDTYKNMTEAGQAVGYIQGIADSYKGKATCLPKGESTDRLVHLVRRHLAEHQGLHHMKASHFVLSALADAYPCK